MHDESEYYMNKYFEKIEYECSSCGALFNNNKPSCEKTIVCPVCYEYQKIEHIERLPFQIQKLDIGSDKWHDWREEGISSDDATIIMCDSPDRSRSGLLLEKIKGVRSYRNFQVSGGNDLKKVALQEYISYSGVNLYQECIVSNKYKWMRDTIDGISHDGRHVVMIKCGDKAYNDTVESKGIPETYKAKLQHSLYVTGNHQIIYWCYLPGSKPILITMTRDENYIERLLFEEKKFIKEIESGQNEFFKTTKRQ